MSEGRIGIAGAVLCFVVLAGVQVVSVPPYWPVDELSNVAYARALAEGELPEVNDPIPPHDALNFEERIDFEQARARPGRLDIWTSNHPPLYFLVAAVPLGLGELLGAPTVGLLGARLVSLIAGALGVWLVGLLALELAPRRPDLAALAAGLAAFTPSLVHVSALVFNDSLSFALATAGLLAAVRWQRRGSERWLLAATVAAGGVAATRATGLVASAVITGLCAAGGWSRRPAARVSGLVRAAGVVGGGSLLLAGWSYLRNLRHYGDLTGATVLLDKFDREPHGTVWEIATSPEFWWNQVERLLSYATTEGPGRLLGQGLVAAVGIGVLLWTLRVLRTRGARPPWLATASLLAALPVGLALLVVVFHSRGGTPHARYLLSGLAVLAIVAAIGLSALPGSSRRIPGAAALAALLVYNVVLWLRFGAQSHDRYHRSGRQFDLRAVELPMEPLWLAVAATGLALGLWLLARGLSASGQPSAASGGVWPWQRRSANTP